MRDSDELKDCIVNSSVQMSQNDEYRQHPKDMRYQPLLQQDGH
jgi:hypothetical protein